MGGGGRHKGYVLYGYIYMTYWSQANLQGQKNKWPMGLAE